MMASLGKGIIEIIRKKKRRKRKKKAMGQCRSRQRDLAGRCSIENNDETSYGSEVTVYQRRIGDKSW
jgi:hypothetical protein